MSACCSCSTRLPARNCRSSRSYLYKSSTPGVLDYLCNRLYTLPERDVERYLSQLTQLAIQRGHTSSLGRVIVGLCAQSLRIAVKVGCRGRKKGGRGGPRCSAAPPAAFVLTGGPQESGYRSTGQVAWPQLLCAALCVASKHQVVKRHDALPGLQAYWLLLAISQDHPKDAHVAALLESCEQAALQGHWQLPFKQSRLPPPLSASPLKRRSDSSRTPLLLSPNDSFSARRSAGAYPMSPDGDSRPMSPDGLGGGLYSSVFMDTGVEGLIYSSPPPESREVEPRDLRAIRCALWHCPLARSAYHTTPRMSL